MDNWYRRLRNLAQWPKKDPPAAAAAPEETPTNWTSPDLERKITLEEGLYRVIYTDNKEAVPDNMTLYYNNKLIGTLAEIKAKGRVLGLGNNMVYNKDGDKEGTVDYLKDKLTARPLTNGGKRKSRRNRKSKKLKKNCKKSNRRR